MSICKGIYFLLQEYLPQILALRNDFTLKEDQSYVSKGDLLCQQLIEDYVRSLEKEYIILSEETYQAGQDFLPEENNIIVIDPIDGTENFVSGLKEWGVGVCVYENNKHVESMVALPELNQLLITGQEVSKFSSRITALSSSLSKEDIANQTSGFEYRITGCTMYNLFNVVMGSFSRYENRKGANCWDILPGINLALEHNCTVKINENNYAGEFLKPGTKYCIEVGQK